MSGRHVAILAVLFAAGCYPPAPVYRVQRAARVPRPTVPLHAGQPQTGPIEVSVGASSLGRAPRPGASEAPEKALEIPEHQVRGELRFRMFERAQLALIHERAIGDATKLDETQADVERGQPLGAGTAVRYSIDPGDARWSIGLDVELMRWQVPYAEYRMCVENCDGVSVSQEIHSASTEWTSGLGITAAYRATENVSLFGGGFSRNHPMIVRKGVELTEYNDEDTENGPWNLLLHAGVAFRYENASALVLISQNTDRHPVRYGPSISAALSIALPDAYVRAPRSNMDEARERMRRAEARRAAGR